MLKKRSYVVDAAQLAMTPRGFVDQFGDQPKRNDLTILAEHETDAEDQLFVFLPDDDKVGVKTIKQYCEMMKEASVSHAILVVKQGVTPFAKTALQEMASTYLIEHFRDAERWHARQVYRSQTRRAPPLQHDVHDGRRERVHRRDVELREVAEARQDPEALVPIITAVRERDPLERRPRRV